VVVVADINAEGVEQVASGITSNGGRARGAHLDVSQGEDVRKLVEETASEHGRLDYMFNNAAIVVAGDVRDMTLEHWRSTIDVDLWGVIYGTLAAYSVMVKQGSGHIVNTSSVAGLIPAAMITPYSAAKHGVVGLSTSLRAEGAALGVKVSVVCPGYVRTPITGTGTILNLKARREDVLARAPLRGLAPAKAARVILRGVARNRSIIIVTRHARIAWWLYRLHPALLAPLARLGVKYFRRLRDKPSSGTPS
jgi:NAD(P)-dependent dehydrogenase (short-subunit alcohol dehydrogenase family)